MLTSKSPSLSPSLLFLPVRCWSGGYPKAWQNGNLANGNWPVVLKWNTRAVVNTVGSPWQKLVPWVKENNMGWCFKLCQCRRWSTCSPMVKDLWERCVIEKILFQSVAISAISTSIFRCLHCGNYVEYRCQIKKYIFFFFEILKPYLKYDVDGCFLAIPQYSHWVSPAASVVKRCSVVAVALLDAMTNVIARNLLLQSSGRVLSVE